MSYQVLARKWRPQCFDEVVGQSHITRLLQNALVRQEVGHAYLLTGTHGVGKTSVARILARALRCEQLRTDGNPCLQCRACTEIAQERSLDVLEIDGASHNGVDHIRQLIENVQYLPSYGKHKIYIIDEVHMLTKEAFNAMLKTLEDPPAHVIFIFATTHPDKILDTILSRCQRLDFRMIHEQELLKQLQKIAVAQGISFEHELLLAIVAREARGSLRDALSMLDQVLSYSTHYHITEYTLTEALGLARGEAIKYLLQHLLSGDVVALSEVYRQLLAENIGLQQMANALCDALYEYIQQCREGKVLQSVQQFEVALEEAFWIFETLVKDFGWSLQGLMPEKTVEIILQKICLRRTFFTSESRVGAGGVQQQQQQETQEVLKEVPHRQENTLATTEVEIKVSTPVEPAVSALMEERNPQDENPRPAEIEKEKWTQKTWDEFVTNLFKRSPTLAVNLEQGNILQEVAFQAGYLQIQLGFRPAERVFLDYLLSKDVFEKLQREVGLFFQCDLKQIQLQIHLVNQELENEGFKTKGEMENIKREERIMQQEREFLKHHYIQAAEELFNTKVDKVIINDHP